MLSAVAMVVDAEQAEGDVPAVWVTAMNAEWAEVTVVAEGAVFAAASAESWAKVAVVSEAMVGAVE